MDLVTSFEEYINIEIKDLPSTNWETKSSIGTHPKRTEKSNFTYEEFKKTNMFESIKFQVIKEKFRSSGEIPEQMAKAIIGYFGSKTIKGGLIDHEFNLKTWGISYIYFNKNLLIVSKNYYTVFWSAKGYSQGYWYDNSNLTNDGNYFHVRNDRNSPILLISDLQDYFNFNFSEYIIDTRTNKIYKSDLCYNEQKGDIIHSYNGYSYSELGDLALNHDIIIFTKWNSYAMYGAETQEANLGNNNCFSFLKIRTKGSFKKGGIYYCSAGYDMDYSEKTDFDDISIEAVLIENIKEFISEMKSIYTLSQVITTLNIYFSIIIKNPEMEEIREIIETVIDDILMIQQPPENNQTFGVSFLEFDSKLKELKKEVPEEEPVVQKNIKIENNFLVLDTDEIKVENPENMKRFDLLGEEDEETNAMMHYAEILSFLNEYASDMEKYKAVIMGSVNTFMLNTKTKPPNDIDIWVNMRSYNGLTTVFTKDGWKILSRFLPRSSKISPNIRYVVNMSNEKYKLKIQIIHVNVDPRDMADQFDLSVAKAIWDPKIYTEGQVSKRVNFRGTETSIINDILNMECEFLERPWDIDRSEIDGTCILTERSKRRILKYMEKGFKIKIHKDSIFTPENIRNFLTAIPPKKFSVCQNFAGFYVIDSIEEEYNELSEKLRKAYNLVKNIIESYPYYGEEYKINLDGKYAKGHESATAIYYFVCKIMLDDPFYRDRVYITKLTEKTKINFEKNKKLIKNNLVLNIEIDP